MGSGADFDDESRDMMDNEDFNLDDLDSNFGDNNCDVNFSVINNDFNLLEMEEESNCSIKRVEDELFRDGSVNKIEIEEIDSVIVI